MSSIQSSSDKTTSPFPMTMNHHPHSHSHSHSLLDDRDDDALVPTSFHSTPPPPLATSPPKSYWDTAFYSSTPTPKPPPRLAPMPRSPPPALSIQTTPTNTSTSNNTPVVATSDRLGGIKSRYALAYQTHNRSLSQTHAHSHHGNNIFSHPNPSSSLPGSGSPSLGSVGTMKSNSNERSSIGIGYNPEQIVDFSTRPQSLSHASPARSLSSSHHNQTHGPLLTPSSSQSSLFSNLPSPLTRTSLSSAASLLRDPPSSDASQGASTSTSTRIGGGDISETSLLQDQTLPPSSSGSTAPTTTISSSMSNDVPNFSSSSRKIYPGLKNTVGPYKLLHSIGQGSFSQVKMAVDTRTGDHVAIKVMSRAMIQSSDRLGISVKRESDLLKSIEHPNIIGFREVVESSLQTCIVLDYASGGELFEFVADKRPLASEADIQYIFAQIVDAVDYLHTHNIVHRDLKLEKPRNGAPLRPKVKLTDFGLAKVIEQGAPLLTTRCGSEDYAAPEIILGQPYDGRQADIWSLGVVLYALLVGFLPFNMRPGMSRKGFLSMIAHAEFGFPGDRVPTKRTSQSNLYAASQSQSQAQTSESKDSTGTLLPAANDGALSAPDTMVVPKMNGVGPVSSESKELVRWLLQTQGSRRPTARELWEHPWVAAGRQAVQDSK
ncbi:CBL-interacting serine/threonine-protein kinase 24 [Podila clonocystis]|nr:CBL-interacting serine/threonine-protein kinase 24 [Podila clonocystis]